MTSMSFILPVTVIVFVILAQFNWNLKSFRAFPIFSSTYCQILCSFLCIIPSFVLFSLNFSKEQRNRSVGEFWESRKLKRTLTFPTRQQ